MNFLRQRLSPFPRSGAGSGGRNECAHARPARCCGHTDHVLRFANCSCGTMRTQR
jgi:hypothetical protein